MWAASCGARASPTATSRTCAGSPGVPRPASTTLLRTLIDTFPQAEVVTAFGQTECSPVTCFLRGEDSIRKIGSVGTPMLNVEVRVVDESMNDVPRGEVGEIVYRSPMVMKEYWNKPDGDRRGIRRWLVPLRRPRAPGRGRLLLRRRPPEGHDHLRRREHLLRRGRGRAGRTPEGGRGRADRRPGHRYGEAPLAVVAPRDPADPPTAEELAAWCRERLARYKNPREYSIVGALPRNPSGKVLKTQLRSEYAPA